jgi:hypothetical protein
MCEIYANGEKPYPGLTNAQVREKVVKSDYRMDLPKDMPNAVGKLVIQCWHKDPDSRPTFKTICGTLEEIGTKSKKT